MPKYIQKESADRGQALIVSKIFFHLNKSDFMKANFIILLVFTIATGLFAGENKDMSIEKMSPASNFISMGDTTGDEIVFVDDTLIITGGAEENYEKFFEIKNNSKSTYKVFWRLEKPAYVEEWETQVCDGNLCYGRNFDQCSKTKPNTFEAGASQKWSLHFFPNNKEGAGLMVMKLYSDKEFTQLLDTLPIVVDMLSGIKDVLAANDISVYPVPADDILNINVEFKKTVNAELFITDKMGRKIKTIANLHQKNAYSTKVDVSGLPAGIYFLNIKTNKGIMSRKITLL